MEFNNSTTEIGICSEIDRICQSTNNSYSLKAKAARVNLALDRYVFLAITNDDNWQFDDTNHLDNPIGLSNLVSGQQEYLFASDVLTIQKVLLKDPSGNWKELIPVDHRQKDNSQAKDIWLLSPSNVGTPTHYDKFASSLLLGPVPNYSQALSLKVVFDRAGSPFVSTDTTKEPGIPSIFHGFLALHASYPFLRDNKKANRHDVLGEILKQEAAIAEYYANRSGEEKTVVRTRYRSSR